VSASISAVEEGTSGIVIRQRGRLDYEQSAAEMRAFTDARTPETPDQIWLLEHPPVFTQGQAGKAEHVLMPGNIPVIKSNRGGQVTYHGPGQLVAYVLLDLHRRGMGIRPLVSLLEEAMVATLETFGIAAHPKPDAPGVYVTRAFDGIQPETRKIGSIGLRVSRGCSYHGLSLNVDMDLEPFTRINPCGYAGLRMTQMRELADDISITQASEELSRQLRHRLT
jgi:lipoyl(octanoyl) transferase|tara:strand:+ start:1546 stop:2214 length:669 start_codon:yes stop_codon:yes gene_type:complete